MKRISMFVLFAVGVGCGANRAAFQPTGDASGSGPGGRPAASYEIRAEHDQPDAWEDDGRTIARVGLEIVNRGETPIWLEPSALRLDAYRNSGARLPSAVFVRTSLGQAMRYVPPREAGEVQLEYVMPVRSVLVRSPYIYRLSAA